MKDSKARLKSTLLLVFWAAVVLGLFVGIVVFLLWVGGYPIG